MAGPLAGIRVVEMGVWVAAPACAAMLSDWGAEVIKVEPPEGDPFRGRAMLPVNAPFELDNRGKRSIALDLSQPTAMNALMRLLDSADVFVSNMRPRALEKHGLDYTAVAERCPRLVHCDITGYGTGHADSDRAALDTGAAYARAGIAMSLTAPGAADPPMPRGGMVDHMTGMAAAGAIAAALYSRERTGKGQRVSIALMRVGAYFMGWDLNTFLRLGEPVVTMTRSTMPNPLVIPYRDRDGRRFWLMMLQGDRHWPVLTSVIGAGHLTHDPRFDSLAARMEHSAELVAILDSIFATRTLAEWAPLFDAHDIWYAPVNRIEDVPSDPVAEAAGVFVTVDSPDGPVRQVATPAQFSATPAAPRGWAPELGQDTEAILQEAGYGWEEILAMKDAGAIP